MWYFLKKIVLPFLVILFIGGMIYLSIKEASWTRIDSFAGGILVYIAIDIAIKTKKGE